MQVIDDDQIDRLNCPFCTDTQLFLDILTEDSDPSQQDELHKLQEDTDFSVDINSRSNEQKVRSIAGEQLWIQVEAKVQDILHEKYLSSPYCLATKLFLASINKESDPSQQDELRKLREDKFFSESINSRSNEQKVRSIAGEKLWKQVETKVQDILHENHLKGLWLESQFGRDTHFFLDSLNKELDPSQQDELRKLREDTDFSVDINSRSNEGKVRSIAGEKLWIQVEGTVHEHHLKRLWLNSPFGRETHFFLDSLDKESDPSQQDEFRKLREETDFSDEINRRSNEQKFRSIAGEKLWIQVEAKVSAILREKYPYCLDTDLFLDTLNIELDPSQQESSPEEPPQKKAK